MSKVTIDNKAVRDAMSTYWKSYQPTLESMMLDANALTLHEEECTEILSYIPNYEGKNVLELGAGIGRFTGVLAKKANHVTAVDFMEEFIEKNRIFNADKTNVDFLCADVTELELPLAKYDLVFTNWLLMYLSDQEVYHLVQKILTWLKKDGFLFVRESCFKPSGKGVSRPSTNPTFYRSPTWYSDNLQHISSDDDDQQLSGKFGLQLERANPVRTYVKFKQNPYQLCFLLKRILRSSEGATSYNSFQAFLDQNQYTRDGILRYERIFGPTFISTGGKATTEEFCKLLHLKDGSTVLDVGCGIGGSAFYMANNYGALVHGVDLSSNMISIALERQNCDHSTLSKVSSAQPDSDLTILDVSKVWFEISDITKQAYPAASYDVVYSRDTILHIGDKERLFRNMLTWLKPGGRLLITDYCRGDQEHSQNFVEYVAQRGYHLLTVKQYGQLLETVGFEQVEAEDKTEQFVEILQREVADFQKSKDMFVKDFSASDFDYIVKGWNSKMQRCKEGDQVWGFFLASKPAHTK